ARTHGTSHYGLERTFKVALDLMVIMFLKHYAHKPIYVFGGCGLISLFCAFVTFFFMIFLKYARDTAFIQTPLPIIAVMFLLVGMISILLGLIAELLMRTYFESQCKRSYVIKKRNVT
ncbi:MAG: glycosyltransferase, partial [Gammaproteobacteria bacterium]